MDLLISFPWGRFYPARREAVRILTRMGDERPVLKWTSVEGIAIAHTHLESRGVIHKCHELARSGEEKFAFAVKWVPVDDWCNTSLDAMKQLIEEKVCVQIQAQETWAMQVHKRRWQQFHTADIVAYLAPTIDRKVDLSNPDKIVWVDVIGRQTAISVLTPGDIFSVVCEPQ